MTIWVQAQVMLVVRLHNYTNFFYVVTNDILCHSGKLSRDTSYE